jgi:hypothetical protein
MTENWRDDRIGSALRGENPTVIAELTGGFAVIGDTQFLPGYCVLLAKDPSAKALAQLPRGQRLQFLADVDLLATAVERACAQKWMVSGGSTSISSATGMSSFTPMSGRATPGNPLTSSGSRSGFTTRSIGAIPLTLWTSNDMVDCVSGLPRNFARSKGEQAHERRVACG